MNFFQRIVLVIFITLSYVSSVNCSELSKAELSNREFQKEFLVSIWTLEDQLKLLENQAYDDIEEKLISLMIGAEKDSSHEWALLNSTQKISNLGKPSYEQSLLPKLNHWVEAKGSFSSLVFRGFWYSGLANYYRGAKWINLVSEEKLLKMRESQKLALDDFQKALKIRPGFSPIYERMIQIASKSGDENLKLSALQAGLKHSPSSFWIRNKYLSTLTPRWGGSYDEMELFINESIKSADLNPKIWSLRGVIFAEKAFLEQLDGNYKEASIFYEKALELGDKGHWIKKLAYCYFRLNEFDKSKEKILKLRKYNEASELVTNRLDKLLVRIKSSQDIFIRTGSGYYIEESDF